LSKKESLAASRAVSFPFVCGLIAKSFHRSQAVGLLTQPGRSANPVAAQDDRGHRGDHQQG